MRRTFVLPFSYSSLAADTSSTQENIVQQGNFIAEGISIFNTTDFDSTDYSYTLQIFDYRGQIKLMDEPVSSAAIESDCRTLFRFPSPWFIPYNTRLIATVANQSWSATITIQVALVGTVIDREEVPQFDRQPFMYSYYSDISYADINAAVTTVGINQQMFGAQSKAPLEDDYELTALTIDNTRQDVAISDTLFAIQVTDKLSQKKLFSTPTLDGLAAGSRPSVIMGAGTPPATFPTNNVQPYILPEPVRCAKGSQLGVQVYPVPSYLTTGQIHTVFRQNVNVLLIGNRILA